MVPWSNIREMSSDVGIFSLLREPKQKIQQKPLMDTGVGRKGEGEGLRVEMH